MRKERNKEIKTAQLPLLVNKYVWGQLIRGFLTSTKCTNAVTSTEVKE